MGVSRQITAYGAAIITSRCYSHPVTFMFVYQITKSVNTYILGSLLVSAGFAYAIEPIFINAEMFILYNWNTLYPLLDFLLFRSS
jgi:hypothetical protein